MKVAIKNNILEKNWLIIKEKNWLIIKVLICT